MFVGKADRPLFRYIKLTLKDQGPYSQHFIFFVTFECSDLASVLSVGSLFSLVHASIRKLRESVANMAPGHTCDKDPLPPT